MQNVHVRVSVTPFSLQILSYRIGWDKDQIEGRKWKSFDKIGRDTFYISSSFSIHLSYKLASLFNSSNKVILYKLSNCTHDIDVYVV